MLKQHIRKLHGMNFRPVPFLLVGIIGGIFSVTRHDAFLATGCLIIVASIYLAAYFFTDIRKNMLALFAAAVILGGLAATLTVYSYQDNIVSEITEDVEITGRIYNADDIAAYGDTKLLLDSLRIEGEKVKGKAYLIWEGETSEYRIGEEWVILGRLRPLGLNLSDGYSVSAFTDGIYYEIIPVSMGKGDSYRPTKAEKARLAVIDKLDESVGGSAAAFLYSMLFGDKSRLDNEIIEDFRLSGTAHVFAVSGLHVGVLAATVIWLLKRLKLRNTALLIVVTIMLAIYAYLSSYSPSVLRASLMAIIVLSARVLGRKNDSISTLCLSAIILLLFKPFWLFDISFLLSFSAVFGIVMLYPPLSRLTKHLGYAGQAVALNLSVNICILPFSLYYFQYFSLLTLPANLIMIPLVSIIYILLLIHLVCCFILPFIGFFGAIIKPLVDFCLSFSAKIANVPGALVKTEAPLVLFAPYYCGVIAVSDYAMFNRRTKILTGAVLFIIFAILSLFIVQ